MIKMLLNYAASNKYFNLKNKKYLLKLICMCDKANSALLLKMSASGSCFCFVTLKVKANISVDTLCQKF